MAKKALINRELKRQALAKKFAAKREAIFAVINDANATILVPVKMQVTRDRTERPHGALLQFDIVSPRL